MIRVSVISTSGHRSGILVELPSMTPLHVEPSDPPEKRQHGMWKVFLFTMYGMCVVASVVSGYYYWMTRICPFILVNVCHNVSNSFRLGICLDGDFSLNLVWNPLHNNKTLRPACLVLDQWQRYSSGIAITSATQTFYPFRQVLPSSLVIFVARYWTSALFCGFVIYPYFLIKLI